MIVPVGSGHVGCTTEVVASAGTGITLTVILAPEMINSCPANSAISLSHVSSSRSNSYYHDQEDEI